MQYKYVINRYHHIYIYIYTHDLILDPVLQHDSIVDCHFNWGRHPRRERGAPSNMHFTIRGAPSSLVPSCTGTASCLLLYTETLRSREVWGFQAEMHRSLRPWAALGQ